jgi:KUP system potassium uptake protein
MRDVWGWRFLTAGVVAAFFLLIDGSFFLANLTKVAEGGYIPLLLAVIIYGIMWTWHRGATAVAARMGDMTRPIPEFMKELHEGNVARVAGTAIFLTRTEHGVPPVMAWHVKHNRALHSKIVILRVSVLPIPWVAWSDRICIQEDVPDVWRVEAGYGFMERPNIPELLSASKALGCAIDLANVTYYVGRETVIHREDSLGLPRWQESLFSMMERNAAHVSDFFNLPDDQVVEIGRQVAI